MEVREVDQFRLPAGYAGPEEIALIDAAAPYLRMAAEQGRVWMRSWHFDEMGRTCDLRQITLSPEEEAKPSCGTCHCFAGWVQANLEKDDKRRELDGYGFLARYMPFTYQVEAVTRSCNTDPICGGHQDVANVLEYINRRLYAPPIAAGDEEASEAVEVTPTQQEEAANHEPSRTQEGHRSSRISRPAHRRTQTGRTRREVVRVSEAG